MLHTDEMHTVTRIFTQPARWRWGAGGQVVVAEQVAEMECRE